VDEIYIESLKLLKRRDYSVAQLKEKLAIKFHDVPPELFQTLLQKHFLDDLRFARNFAAKRRGCHPSLVRTELLNAGISTELAECALAEIEWPSLPAVCRGYN
jgi:SOS response regulatory protein OraA/RecX